VKPTKYGRCRECHAPLNRKHECSVNGWPQRMLRGSKRKEAKR